MSWNRLVSPEWLRIKRSRSGRRRVCTGGRGRRYADFSSWSGHSMRPITLDLLTEQLDLAERLRTGRDAMFEPQDLPGRYGRVVKAIDRLMKATGAEAVL